VSFFYAFHVHVWTEHARTYAPPMDLARPRVVKVRNLPATALHGVTTFVFRCADPTCGAMKTVQALGQAVYVAP
jgi:hypothetical protein